MFHNTVKLKNEALKQAQEKTESQAKVVKHFFIKNQDRLFTPWEVWEQAFSEPRPLITSVRRTMTDLTHEWYLEKTETQEVDRYNVPNYCWRYSPQKQLF